LRPCAVAQGGTVRKFNPTPPVLREIRDFLKDWRARAVSAGKLLSEESLQRRTTHPAEDEKTRSYETFSFFRSIKRVTIHQ
jgi:hypothetical protein